MKKILLLNLLFLNFFTTINAEETYEEYENDEYEEISEDLLAYIQENEIEEGEELVREARCLGGSALVHIGAFSAGSAFSNSGAGYAAGYVTYETLNKWHELRDTYLEGIEDEIEIYEDKYGLIHGE